MRSDDLSRLVSHALRHEPWLYELEPDEQGWVGLDQLVRALTELGGAGADVDEAAVRDMVGASEKKRHEIQDGRIRARYGHSLPGRITLAPASPPERLFHGTSPAVWEVVPREGLRPMSRQYVHLSADVPTALGVGRRKSSRPVLLVVDAAAAVASGVQFHAGNERVWLADRVAAEHVRRARPDEGQPT